MKHYNANHPEGKVYDEEIHRPYAYTAREESIFTMSVPDTYENAGRTWSHGNPGSYRKSIQNSIEARRKLNQRER